MRVSRLSNRVLLSREEERTAFFSASPDLLTHVLHIESLMDHVSLSTRSTTIPPALMNLRRKHLAVGTYSIDKLPAH